MKCKYCEQPIYETEKEESYPGNGIWIHMRGKYRHIKNDEYYCLDSEINKSNPNYQTPKCHICETETDEHGIFCSACGFPPHRATPIKNNLT